MSGRAVFDTNVLLYMYAGDRSKGAVAIRLYEQFAEAGTALLSTQILQEFYYSATRKLGIPRDIAREVIVGLSREPVVVNGPAEILHAIAIEQRYQISFWDALILAAAESGGANTVFTEDLSDGQQYGSVTVRNPFRAAEPAH